MCIYFLLTSMELTLSGVHGPGGLSDRAHVFSACIYIMPTLDSDTAITTTPRILRGLPDKSKYEHQRRLDGANKYISALSLEYIQNIFKSLNVTLGAISPFSIEAHFCKK